jgi:hypothetical protein
MAGARRKRKRTELDNAVRLLAKAETAAGTNRADDLIQIADRYIALWVNHS